MLDRLNNIIDGILNSPIFIICLLGIVVFGLVQLSSSSTPSMSLPSFTTPSTSSSSTTITLVLIALLILILISGFHYFIGLDVVAKLSDWLSPHLDVVVDTSRLKAAGNAPVPEILLRKQVLDRKSTRLNSSHVSESRMPSSA